MVVVVVIEAVAGLVVGFFVKVLGAPMISSARDLSTKSRGASPVRDLSGAISKSSAVAPQSAQAPQFRSNQRKCPNLSFTNRLCGCPRDGQGTARCSCFQELQPRRH